MDTVDVLIVGAGPAGSTCARGVRGGGLKVLVVDAAEFPRQKVCGGWITPHVVEALGLDLADYASSLTLQPISAFRVGLIGTASVEWSYDMPVSYAIRRNEFDDYLLRRCGVQIRHGFRVAAVRRWGDQWWVRSASGEEVHARLLVGAGGHFCPVARYLCGTDAQQPIVAQETEFPMSVDQTSRCAVRRGQPEIYFCGDLLGYGWCIRKGNYLNVGLGRLDPHRFPERVKQFVDFLRRSGRIGFPLPPMKGHAYYAFGFAQRDPISERALLIGDAAGLAFPQSGEGIRSAVESGLLAAKAILEAQGCYSRERLAPYAEALVCRLRSTEGCKAGKLLAALPTSVRSVAARLMVHNTGLCRSVIEGYFLRSSRMHSRSEGAAA